MLNRGLFVCWVFATFASGMNEWEWQDYKCSSGGSNDNKYDFSTACRQSRLPDPWNSRFSAAVQKGGRDFVKVRSNVSFALKRYLTLASLINSIKGATAFKVNFPRFPINAVLLLNFCKNNVRKGVATSMIPLPSSSAWCLSASQTNSWSAHFVTLQSVILSRELNFFFFFLRRTSCKSRSSFLEI